MKNIIALLFVLISTSIFSQTIMADPSSDKPQIESTAANFPNGNKAFQQLLVNNFKGRNVDCEIAGHQSTTIEFTVENDGTLSEIKSKGANQSLNTEAIRVVKSINIKWIPAKSDGKNVRSKFTQPFQFFCD